MTWTDSQQVRQQVVGRLRGYELLTSRPWRYSGADQNEFEKVEGRRTVRSPVAGMLEKWVLLVVCVESVYCRRSGRDEIVEERKEGEMAVRRARSSSAFFSFSFDFRSSTDVVQENDSMHRYRIFNTENFKKSGSKISPPSPSHFAPSSSPYGLLDQ
jgi:hypothetical protein